MGVSHDVATSSRIFRIPERLIALIILISLLTIDANTPIMTANLSFLDDMRAKYAHQPVFLQSLDEMAVSLLPLFDDPDQGEFYQRAFLAIAEPERTISFRVSWMDDEGNLQFNRGWRVEFNRYDYL